MIDTLNIANFKSIRQLSLPCRRVNVFLGPPNSGKSNLLEALAFFSFVSYGSPKSSYQLADFIRFEDLTNLFYDENIDAKMTISFDAIKLEMHVDDAGTCRVILRSGMQEIATYSGSGKNFSRHSGNSTEELDRFKSYRFSPTTDYRGTDSGYLAPPFGPNLFGMLLRHKHLRALAAQPFASLGLRLVLRTQERKLEIQKAVDDVIVTYPYSLVSDTLRRLVFYLAAILPSRESILILEEPEVHAFPSYTKYLAETIALDENDNQYFLSTHNPYLLLPLLEKCPAKDIAVNITKLVDYETRTRQLTSDELSELDTVDIFSNIDRYEM